MPYEDKAARRFWSARESYRRPQWTDEALLDKSNSLALRLLALDVIIKERTGVPLLAKGIQQALLALVETTGVDDAKAKKDVRQGPEYQPLKPRVRRPKQDQAGDRVDVQDDGDGDSE